MRKTISTNLFCKYRNRLAVKQPCRDTNGHTFYIIYVLVDISDKRLPKSHSCEKNPNIRFKHYIKFVTNDMILNDQSEINQITHPRTLAILKELATIRKS